MKLVFSFGRKVENAAGWALDFVLGRGEPDEETVGQALDYRKALARRPDWNHPIAVAVVEVCGNDGYNWFDMP